MIRHHLDPIGALYGFDKSAVILPKLAGASDFKILDAKAEVDEIQRANELSLPALTNQEVDHLIAFLNALTDRKGVDGRLGVPTSVPSGLPVPTP